MHHYTVSKPDESLYKAVNLLLDTQEHSFIVEENNEVKEILSRKEIIEGLSKFGKDVPVEKVMRLGVASLNQMNCCRISCKNFLTILKRLYLF